MKSSIALLISLAVGLWTSQAAAQIGSFEAASSKLHAATLTLRIIPNSARPTPVAEVGQSTGAQQGGQQGGLSELAARAQKTVTVCTGTSIGDGLVVTYAALSSSDEIRITIPGGEQAKADLRVIDHVSGLTLLEIDNEKLPGLSSAKDAPRVGQWVLASAAWGAEKPVVSFGILSGTDRTIRGANLPALLQCDLRTAETSSGSPLVNSEGELLGVVVAADTESGESRWTYAVPVRHVQRLVRARHPDKVVEIQRRRPVVGLKLQPGKEAGTVVVGRVEENGPAAKAGIRSGDQVLAADGRKVRSVYEVVRPLLSKQPGDTMKLLVKNGDLERDVDIVLGGGMVVSDRPTFAANQNVAPRRIVIEPLSFQGFDVKNTAAAPQSDPAAAATAQQVELLQKAVERYGLAVLSLKEELNRRDRELAERDEVIKQLRQQLEAANSR